MGQERVNKCDRREFFIGVGRLLALGSLTAISWALLAARRKVPEWEKCTAIGICHTCPALDSCGLPRALMAKPPAWR